MTEPYDPPSLSQAFGDRGQTPPSTWSSKPSENYRPKPSAKIRGLIGRLGLRFHPANSADLASHQAALSLMAEDLAHIDPDMLERAIDRHVMTSKFMPRAAELIALAQSLMQPETSLHAYAEQLNDQSFSREQGWFWRVGVPADGPRYLDRIDAKNAPAQAWKPSQREIEITNEVVAEFVRDPSMTQERFSAFVQSGAITRAVAKRMEVEAA